MVQTPNFTRGQGRLATDRFDFEKHVNGESFNHEANGVLLTPGITIDGYVKSNVREALEALTVIAFPPTIVDADVSTKGILKLTNDLGGTADVPKVVGLQNIPISTQAPNVDELLTFNGTSWIPMANAATFIAGGDLTGDNLSQLVYNISGSGGLATITATTVRFVDGVSVPLLTQESSSSAAGVNLNIIAQGTSFSNANGGNVILSGGAKNGTGIKGGVKLQLNNSSSDTLLQATEAASGQRIIGLFKETIDGSNVTSGDKVLFVGDAATAPSTNPVDGFLLYSEGGLAKVRQGSDTITFGSIPNPSVWEPTLNGKVITRQYSFTTTNATQATANDSGFTLLDDSTSKFDVIVVARRTDASTSQTAQFNLTAGYVTVASTATQIGTTTSADTRATTGATTWSATIDNSSNIVRVRVTGEAAKTISWFILLQATIGT